MPLFHRPPRDPDDDHRGRACLEDDQDEETRLNELLDRAAERASLPFWHPSVHRLARLERARRVALTDGRWAA